jgi:DUF4097 and DUF4098 domain-containing protein YvlB
MEQQKWLVESPKTIDLDEAVHTLKVALVAGHVDIIGHDEPTTRVEVHSVSGKPLRVSIADGKLEVDHPQLGWDNWTEVFKFFKGSAKADVSILVPRGLDVKLGVVSAQALVSGLNADISGSTVSGELVIEGVTGDLRLNTVGGELSVQNHYGTITAHSVSGDVTASGTIGAFSTDTVSGSVFLDLAGIPDKVSVKTVSGTVTTRLEPGVPAQYRITTVSGHLQLDDHGVKSVNGTFTGSMGALDERFLEFSANTVSGDVSLLHAVTA